MNSAEMRFLRGIKNKTRFDRIINEASEWSDDTMQKWKKKDLLEKYTRQKNTEQGKGKKVVKRRTEKGMWNKSLENRIGIGSIHRRQMIDV